MTIKLSFLSLAVPVSAFLCCNVQKDLKLIYSICSKCYVKSVSALLTFPWTELQVLLKGLIHITIIVLWSILYLVYLCSCLGLHLFLSYLCDIFFIFSVISNKPICSLTQIHLFLAQFFRISPAIFK